MKKTIYTSLLATSLFTALPLNGQSFNQVNSGAQEKLESALEELAAKQEAVAKEKIPMAQKLNRLESEVGNLRSELRRLERLRDSRDLNLSALENEIEARRDEIDYAKNLLVEFINNQTASSDASERQLYEGAFLEILNSTSTIEGDDEQAASEAIEQLVGGVELGLERLNTLVGGHTFEGNAVLPDGNFETGKFVLFGPVTYFASSSGSMAGLTVQGDSGEPTLIELSRSFGGMSESILVGGGTLPLDPTLGKALALETTKDTLVEHIQKGGFWIYPILSIAVISLIIAIFKLFELSNIKRIPKDKFVTILTSIQEGKHEAALKEARSLSGDGQELVTKAIQNIGHGRDLIEQSMEEVLMKMQPKVERLISIVWITAATAPLLGLLGTVTGIITTFKLLTIFGSGDPKALGGGISEALITTEFGLIVAIPSLILHAFLHRKAKAIENEFEGDAMTLLNGILRAEKK
ncbi:MAG: hypothetical protein GVY36_14720 [Verrucomicrobia bacterium]|jgi:biopolymer transport protein ExbB|nr:hypothetical protein [Verrucomicrobiota bacterium]